MGVWPILTDVGGLKESSIINNSSIINKDDAEKFINEIENVLKKDFSPSLVASIYQEKYNIENFSSNLIKMLD